jgi:2-oxoglutarate ferredoxin oxidoreductase subunit alpha
MGEGLRARGFAVVLAGEAGQGIQTVEEILVRVCRRAGWHVFATKEYMSRVRGGVNSTLIRLDHRPVAAPLDRIDLLVPLAQGAVPWLGERVGRETLVLADPDLAGPDLTCTGCGIHRLPFTAAAREAGGGIFTGVVAAGAVCGLLGVAEGLLEEYLGRRFAPKGEAVVGRNLSAAAAGLAMGRELAGRIGPLALPPASAPTEGRMLANGAEAVGLGALAGGCDFIASYPMSPSTGVLAFLARHAAAFGLVAEQAEDEIAAVNMALGAWYAGARAMVTTSGGGFALMTEGISLAGMIESPLVVHLAQRPGPATGLPTRTEQGDLNLVLHAGHGEFPRAVYAPGTVEEAFALSRLAFQVADRRQVPVFLLTDQYLVDSYLDVPPLDPGEAIVRYVQETEADYHRYLLTEDGLSPRGIPGHGRGLVGVDSDEHDQWGRITERADVRRAMVEKRARKGLLLLEDLVPPTLLGPPRYDNLVVGWGSTREIVREALELVGAPRTAFLHCAQVHPLGEEVSAHLAAARRVITLENNAGASFTRLLEEHTGISAEATILKYDGRPFTVEEAAARIAEVLA